MLKKKQRNRIQMKILAVMLMMKIQIKRDLDCSKKKMKN